MSLICDSCKKPINKFSEGVIEYMFEVLNWGKINADPNNFKPTAIHLVHHKPASLVLGGCYFDNMGNKRFITGFDHLDHILGDENNRVSQNVSIDLLIVDPSVQTNIH